MALDLFWNLQDGYLNSKGWIFLWYLPVPAPRSQPSLFVLSLHPPLPRVNTQPRKGTHGTAALLTQACPDSTVPRIREYCNQSTPFLQENQAASQPLPLLYAIYVI